MVIRLFDVLFALLGLILGLPLFALLWLMGLWDTGSPLFCQQRVGRNQRPFVLLKFRTMRPDTASVPTRLADASAITPFGRFMRRTKLDELPQLWCILRGQMSFVGPRPALFNQDDLIALRTDLGIDKLLPGLTGWAQVNGRDELPIPQKVALDVEYMQRQSFLFDLKILWMTALKVLTKDGVSH